MTRTGLIAVVIGGLIVAGALAFFVSPLASSSPDGLEKVATDEGFIDTAEDHDRADGPLADYGVQGVDDESLSTGLSGVIGVAITFGVALVLFGIFHSRRDGPRADPDARSPATS